MGWKDSNFPNADDPQEAGWMIMYWRIVPCASGCKDDYRLESRQFEHLPKSATLEEAQAVLAQYVANRRASGNQEDSRKGLTLFLCKVVDTVEISDITGEIIGVTK